MYVRHPRTLYERSLPECAARRHALPRLQAPAAGLIPTLGNDLDEPKETA